MPCLGRFIAREMVSEPIVQETGWGAETAWVSVDRSQFSCSSRGSNPETSKPQGIAIPTTISRPDAITAKERLNHPCF
jgi:hypothetical protein